MADIDSRGASNRQAPATVKRATAAPRPKSTVSGHPTQRRRVVSKPKVTRTVKKVSSNRNYSKNQGQSRVRAAQRRSTSRKTSSSSTPKPTQAVAKRIVPPSPPKPVAPDINKFLAGDSTYQRQLADFGKSLSDFQADQGLASTDYTTNYGNTRRDIGLAKTDASEGLEEDYASRGMLKSGLYNEALGELNQQYQNQYVDLDKQKTSFMDQLAQELKKYQGEQGVQKGNAYADAARRRAEKYNL